MRIRINAGGREVDLQTDSANVTPDQIADKALQVWQATASAARAGEGPAFGVQAEAVQERTTTGSLVIGVVE